MTQSNPIDAETTCQHGDHLLVRHTPDSLTAVGPDCPSVALLADHGVGPDWDCSFSTVGDDLVVDLRRPVEN